MEYSINISNLEIKQKKGLQATTLDSILIADYVKINKNSKNILEIGSGFGYISMYIGKKSSANILGIEINKESYDLSNFNVKNNKIDNVQFINEDILNYKMIFKEQSFDIIVSNPPYFKFENIDSVRGKKIENDPKIETNLSIEKIIEISNYLLKNNSSLYLIFRSERLAEIISYLKKFNMEIKNLKSIYTKFNDEKALLSMIRIVKGAKIGLIIERPIYIYKENGVRYEEIEKFYTKTHSNNNGW